MATKTTTVAKATKTTTVTASKAPVSTTPDTTKAASKKAAEKKESVKKAAAKKEAAKAPAKKPAKVVAPALFLQVNGKEYAYDDIIAMIKAAWKDQFNGKVKDFVNVQVYIKPEDNKAYFVVNGEGKPEYFVVL